MFDADHDGDLDLLLIKSDGAVELLNNNGDGTFRCSARRPASRPIAVRPSGSSSPTAIPIAMLTSS
jgi:hypothetical protein